MRLGQLARKLSLTPSEVVQFLSRQNIVLAEDSNAKLQDEHVELLLKAYGKAETAQVPESETPEANRPLQVEQEALPESQDESTEQVSDQAPDTDTSEERGGQAGQDEIMTPEVELIRAPKVALPGLKVVGKIELPEKKKPETPESTAAEEPHVTETMSDGEHAGESQQATRPAPRQPARKNARPDQRRGRENKPRKNPIALRREREAYEAEQRKKEEARRRKELRTDRYLKKIQPPEYKPRKKQLEEEYEVLEETVAQVTPPKTWLGRLWRWLKPPTHYKGEPQE